MRSWSGFWIIYNKFTFVLKQGFSGADSMKKARGTAKNFMDKTVLGVGKGGSERQLPIRKHREERENGIASAVPFSHFSIDAVTFDISKAPMPL